MATTAFARRLNNGRVSADGDLRPAERAAGRHRSQGRKGTPCRKSTIFYVAVSVIFVLIITTGTYYQNKLIEIRPWPRGEAGDGERAPARRPPPGSKLWFRPVDLMRRLEEQGRNLDQLRSERRQRVRPPSLALVVGSMNKDAQSLMLLTIVKGLRELGYIFMVFALEDGEARFLWEHVGCQVSILHLETASTIDWSNYEGVILSSLESKRVVTSLMQQPFDSVPLIWLIQEDILGKRLPSYEALGREDLITTWRSAFSRADVVVFPDFSLPMIYTSLDIGNFYVIPASPVNVWEAESYIRSHSRHQLRRDNGFGEDDLIILVIGSYYFYDELPWDYAATMNALTSEITRVKGQGGILKLAFLCGNSTAAHDFAFQELASRMGLPVDSVRHYGMDGGVNSLLLMADLILYGSYQEEQSFPPLLVRAMSFEVPIIVPNLDIITKYVRSQVHGLIFHPQEPESLARALSLLIEDKKLSNLARSIASNGKLLSKNLLALDCIVGYAKLFENVLLFPSDAILPLSFFHIKQNTWAWGLFENKYEQTGSSVEQNFKNSPALQKLNLVDFLEDQMISKFQVGNTTQAVNDSLGQDFPTQLDWDVLHEMEMLEDLERREREEVEERMGRNLGLWEDVYRKAKKSDGNKLEPNERDEGEIERIGRQLCIYEIYSGEGAWPFLHRGSLYRGLSLSKRARRSRSDDVDAVARLPILDDAYYRDLLCEFGAMFSIANKVDSIHKIPWIGFQSWHAAGKKVSLSVRAEEVLEEIIQQNSNGDVIYYWALMDMDKKHKEEAIKSDFWSMCDILNAGHCRDVFEDAFRLTYGLPKSMPALPPMPADGDQWSTLNSWVMPTPSFLEFVMFSRMFVDSIDNLNQNNGSSTSCMLGSSELEKRHCYCRVFDILVNVWAYHSARRMVYLDPSTGEISEQHPVEQRTGNMWVKYFNITLLKSMDEDLAEEADDDMHPTGRWLWPLTGEVHWQGIFDREREDRFRNKMSKKIKNKEKLLDRQKFGYKQKSLG